MNQVLAAVNRLRQVDQVAWRAEVREVAVILTSSRSGSTLLKSVLAEHPRIASLDGEIEPYLVLTENGFGHGADCDAVTAVRHVERLADHVFGDLSLPCAEAPPAAWQRRRWANRLLLQFPAFFADSVRHRRMLEALEQALAQSGPWPADPGGALRQALILQAVFVQAPWRRRYYDGHAGAAGAEYFDEPYKIEEPPFVLPRHGRRPFALADAADKLLLFKAPSDAYRIGMYEQLFPRARVRYVHLSRGYAQSVNGLMDGWLSPLGFFSHDMARAGVALDIAGYSDQRPFGRRWWKFDLPPGWRALRGAPLAEVCLRQWLAAHQAILGSGVAALRVRFEDFMTAPAATLAGITDFLGLEAVALPVRLPLSMATEAPAPGRWRKREQAMLALGERAEVAAMMAALDYSMDAGDWR
ncbi:hypothetical protein ACFOLJ_05860 [Rugamonas sp. CCM 8940]|uniref:hypothetical protein n=1 Tax=Rugamonas sp. CCM 8940 TaxID=2765359 RepID=UPI0018F29920|nr:hypothetical protein [Rugamonas sp. CCM 8940]MBJ7312751.1 hypothetical protein [Rugamonas sp. CCM 8940]